jgi:two-component sensor histidine kinase
MMTGLSSARSFKEIMEAVVQPARALLGAGGATFVLREGDYCYYAEENAISPLWKGQRFPLDSCISGWCIRQGKEAAISDIYSDLRIPHEAYRATFVRSLAMVPVQRDQPIAALGAYWADPHTPTRHELDLLRIIANAAALAVDNVVLSEQSAMQDALYREQGHRLKNVFSSVLALTRLTVAKTVPDYRSVLSARIGALEETYGELASLNGDPRDLGQLLRRLLRPVLEKGEERIELSGPRIDIGGVAIVPLGLAINELLTNALKHGSLSHPEGKVRCMWRLSDHGARLRWAEVGGPEVRHPLTAGLGIKLIGSFMQSIGGTADISFEKAGLTCSLDIPTDRRAAEARDRRRRRPA